MSICADCLYAEPVQKFFFFLIFIHLMAPNLSYNTWDLLCHVQDL